MHKKILVTGSRGFIGKHLVKALEEHGHNITEFDLVSVSYTHLTLPTICSV